MRQPKSKERKERKRDGVREEKYIQPNVLWSGLSPNSEYAAGRAVLESRGEVLAAIDHFDAAIRGNPNLWPAHANLAAVQAGLGDVMAALEATLSVADAAHAAEKRL